MLRGAFLLAVCLGVAACVSVKRPDHTALVKGASGWSGKVEGVGERWKQYRLGQMPERVGAGQKSEDILLVAALSGGGKRSAAFAYGVLQTLGGKTPPVHESPNGAFDPRLRIPIWMPDGQPRMQDSTILKEIDIITAASGGALTASYFALHREKTFVGDRNTPCSFEKFLFEDTGARIIGLYTLPWKWRWMFDSSLGSNDLMASFFAQRLFTDDCEKPLGGEQPYGATFGDLYDSYEMGSPFLILQSTDIARGIAFSYHQDSFDLLCSDISPFPLGWAVAGSNGFPVILSSIGRRNYHYYQQGKSYTDAAGKEQPDLCRPESSPWFADEAMLERGCAPTEEFVDDAISGDLGVATASGVHKRTRPSVRLRLLQGIANCYIWPGEAIYAQLADGGMTDNFALRGLSDWFAVHEFDSAFMHVVGVTRRVMVMVIDGQRETDLAVAKDEAGPSVTSAIPAMISNNVDQGNVASLSETADTLKRISQWLEVRDLVVARRAWEQHKRDTDDKVEAKTFADWVRHGDFARAFERAFEHQARTILELERQVAKGATPLSELRRAYDPIVQVYWLRYFGDEFGTLKLRGINWKVLANITGTKEGVSEFLSEVATLKSDLQSIVFWREKNNERLTDIVKVSLVDDCNSARKDFLADSDTGLGLDEPVIAAAIEAGRDVAARHLPLIKRFVERGLRTDRNGGWSDKDDASKFAACEEWAAMRGVTAAPETLELLR